MRKWIVFLAVAVILALVNISIHEREKLLGEGQSVFLELAPVDPRSLMQGDYMALRFDVANQIQWQIRKDELRDGYTVLQVDRHGVATFSHLQDQSPPGKGQVRMRYRVRNGAVKFATDAFFFQEGDAGLYEPARYGEFRVGSDGESILVGMRDVDLKPVGRFLTDNN